MSNTSTMIIDGVMYIVKEPSTPVWMRLLALFGALSLFNFAINKGFDIIKFTTYLIGLLKYIFVRFRR